MKQDEVMQYAPMSILKFAAGCLVIAMSIVWILISAKAVGANFEPIFEAWAQSIKFDGTCVPSDIELRLRALEENSHAPGAK